MADTLRYAITGASGLLGSHLADHLRDRGDEVVPLVRSRDEVGDDTIYWNVRRDEIDVEALEGFDVVVHLAGENVFGRWNDDKKQRILESRKHGTELLCNALADLDDPPDTLVSASAVGFYGDTGTEWVDEDTPAGDGFLADVCREWEAATEPAESADIRTVHLRTGVALSRDGGALSMMLTPFRFGLGGRIGSGDQYFPWLAVVDYVRGVEFIVRETELAGPVNMVAPNPVTNAEFVETLGDVLGRPTILPVPSFGAKLVFGEMADEVLLAGQRVRPAKLQEAGFEWEHPNVESALTAELAAS